jgi:hypothetical protein
MRALLSVGSGLASITIENTKRQNPDLAISDSGFQLINSTRPDDAEKSPEIIFENNI